MLSDSRQPIPRLRHAATPFSPRARLEETRALAENQAVQKVPILFPPVRARDDDLDVASVREDWKFVLWEVCA